MVHSHLPQMPFAIRWSVISPFLIRVRRLASLVATFTLTAGAHAASEIELFKQLSIEELMALEVTSVSRSPTPFGDAPSALQVITAQQIRRSGASNLPEALRLATNLNVARKNSHDWGISARGFNTELSNKLLVLIDGRAVYTPLWSGVRWDVQDYLLEDLDRIEVISGPGGSLWGANAVNGVINIMSKRASATQGMYAEAGGGNQLKEFEALRYGGRLAPGVFFRVYGKHFERNSEVFGNGTEVGDGSSLQQGGFRLDAEATSAGTFTFQGDYYHGREGVAGAGNGKVAGGNLLSRWSQTLPSGSELSLQLYYDRAFLRLPFAPGPFGPAGTFTDDLATYDLDFQYDWKTSTPHHVVWGFGYRLIDDHSTPAPALGLDPPDARQAISSLFVQDQIALDASSILTLGTKLEHTGYTGVEVEPSIRLQRSLDETAMVWTAISRAVRIPSRIDRDVRQPSRGPSILAGSDRFASETVVAYEVGARANVGPHLVGSISGFYNDYRQIRSVSPTPVTVFPLLITNDLEGETYGVELSFDADVTPWARLHGGYTLLRSDLRVRAGGTDLNNALNETADPEHQFALGVSLDLPGGIEFDSHLRWVDTLRTNVQGQVGTIPSYADLNVRLGFRLSEQLEASVVGQNLLDDHHPEIGTPGPALVEIRRSVFAKLVWRY